MKQLSTAFLFFVLSFLINSCSQIPSGVQPVNNFDASKYIGTWYEIARLDHSFERDLVNVTATYELAEKNKIVVINKGFNTKSEKWEEIKGKAKFYDKPNVAQLKVSFFGPFYAGYNVIELDTVNYKWALVCGNSRDYLWILSRTPEISDSLKNKLVASANEKGFNTKNLFFVSHSVK